MLRGLGGTTPLLIICALLFAEEAGVPIPVAPGEAVLIGGGLLIASGSVPFWLAMPAEFVAVVADVIPGLRIYTTLAAGALGVDLRRFVLGILPAAAVWVTTFGVLSLIYLVIARRSVGRTAGEALMRIH